MYKTTDSTKMLATIPQAAQWLVGQEALNESTQIKTFSVTSVKGAIDLAMQGCVSPFEPSSFEGAIGNRLTLTLRLPTVWDTAWAELEEGMIAECASQSARLFGQKLSVQALKSRYKPVTQQTDPYPRHLRCKVNTSGYHATRYWDDKRNRCQAPESHIGATLTAMVRIKAIWVSRENFGLVVDCCDLQCVEPVATCPF